MTQKRKTQSKHGRILRILPALVAGISLLFLASAQSTAHKKLSSLPVPASVTKTTYSGLLTLDTYNESVLGAQPINIVDFVNEINKERNRVGSPALRLNTTLIDAAKLRAEVILKYQNFSHQDPHEGIELATVLPKLNYHYVYATENIGMGGVSASNFVEGFMNSTSHKNNLLNPNLTDTGAAIIDGPFGSYYVNVAVQLFAIPGGKDEYLGYTKEDKKAYQNNLKTLTQRLNPVIWLINSITDTQKYNGSSHQAYTRQKAILEEIVPRLQQEKPLDNRDVALILEYNELL